MVLPRGSQWLEGSQESAPAYLHAFFGQDSPWDSILRKLIKIQRGTWGLVLVFRIMVTSSQTAKCGSYEGRLETFMAI